MASRTDLQSLLESILGSNNVYYQPPSGHEMSYPAIVYERSDISTAFAGNLPYKLTKQYRITVIDANPDSIIPDAIAALPSCVFDRNFKSGQLNHDVFTIQF